MFQRFASTLFGDDGNEPSRGSQPGGGKQAEEEDEEDWILVNYLGKPDTQLKTFARTQVRGLHSLVTGMTITNSQLWI